MTTLNNTSVVWSQDRCPYCDQAKFLLKQKGYEVTEKQIGKNVSKEEFFATIPGARTVPQIFINGKLIPGGFQGLEEFFNANS